MPRRHQVPMLVDLALRSIGEFVATIGRSMIQRIRAMSKTNIVHGDIKLRSMLKFVKCLLSSSVPRHLYDKMFVVILTAIVNLVKETKGTYNNYTSIIASLSEISVILDLTEVTVGANLKTIEFSAWPKIIRNVLYNKLHDMVGLQVLDLGSGSAGWRTSQIEKVIINSVSAMPNLVCFTLCFDCTDNVIAALAQNCKKLQKLDIMASRSVTVRSVAPLLTCQYLRQVKLFRTSITVSGYAELILKHPRIEDIGRCDEFGYVLKLVHDTGDNFENSLHIKTFESRNLNMEQLCLLVDTCPYVTSLCLLCDDKIKDLTILANLSNLKALKLLSCDFYTHGLKTLLETKGSTITSLHLEHVEKIDLNALICMSQYCPNMKSLGFYDCEFLEHAPVYLRKLPVPPFICLEKIKCIADCANMHLEFLLSHCVNIKFVQLGSSSGIGDTTIRRILSQNPMIKLEELKILYSHDLSMKTVQLLMQNCTNLQRLSALESWQGITPAELNAFREKLRVSNINLDTTPRPRFGSGLRS